MQPSINRDPSPPQQQQQRDTPKHSRLQSGCIAVPNLNLVHVLLILDVSASSNRDDTNTSDTTSTSAVAYAWQQLKALGFPSLLMVPAVRIASFIEPAHPNANAPATPDERLDDGGVWQQWYAAQRQKGTDSLSFSLPLLVTDVREACGEGGKQVRRLFALAPPNASALATLLHLLPRRSLARAPSGDAASYDLKEGMKAPAIVLGTCRDVWPIPPMQAGVRHTEKSEEEADGEAEDDADGAATAAASSTALVEEQEKAALCVAATESSSAAAAAGQQHSLSALLHHLSKWNSALLIYLARNALHVHPRWARRSSTATGNAASPARPSVRSLLRLLFGFWHRVLRMPVDLCARKLKEDTSGDAANATTPAARRTQQQDRRGFGNDHHPRLSLQRPAEKPKTTRDAEEASALFLGTPTQISRAYFQTREHQKSPQSPPPQLQQLHAAHSGDAGTPVAADVAPVAAVSKSHTHATPRTSPPPSPSTVPSAYSPVPEAASDTQVDDALSNIATTTVDRVHVTRQEAPLAVHFHSTPVVVVEQLAMGIEFACTYEKTKSPAAQERGISVEAAWTGFLMRRLRHSLQEAVGTSVRSSAAGGGEACAIPLGSGNNDKAAAATALQACDVQCTVSDIWREWAVARREAEATCRAEEEEEDGGEGDEGRSNREGGGSAATAVHDAPQRPPTAPAAVASPSPHPPHVFSAPAHLGSTHDNNTTARSAATGMTTPSVAAAAEERQGSPSSGTAPSAASPMSSPSLLQPSWPAPAQLRKHSASHVSFSVSDVRRPYTTTTITATAPAAATTHVPQRTPSAPLHAPTIRAPIPHHDSRPLEDSTSAAAAAAAAAVVELLHVVPAHGLEFTYRKGVEDGARGQSVGATAAKHTRLPDTQSGAMRSACVSSGLPDSLLATAAAAATTGGGGGAPRSRPSLLCGTSSSSRAHSELPSVAHTALPLRSAPPSSPQERPPPLGSVESWESSASGSEHVDAAAASASTGPQLAQPEGQLEPHGSNARIDAAPPQRAFSTKSTLAPGAVSTSTSSSLIASEHRVFPLLDDDADSDGASVSRPPQEVKHAPHGASASHAAAPTAPPTTAAAAAAAGLSPEQPLRPRRTGWHSAAAFTALLSDLLAEALSASAPAAFAATQRRLHAIHRGDFLPSLATLDALNVLPYYVQVWCYTFDPLKLKRRSIDGGMGGGGAAGGSASGDVSGRNMQTYLQRYEVRGGGGSGGGVSGGGYYSDYLHGGGMGGGRGSAVGVSSPQLLLGLMRDGAGVLWRGARGAVTRGAGASTQSAGEGTNAAGPPPTQAMDLTHTAAAAAATPSAVYGGGAGGGHRGGRDPTQAPTLYNAVCGLYVTEQDIVIRSLPTAEVRKRRAQARLRQQMQRDAERRSQQVPSQQQQQQRLRRHRSAVELNDGRVPSSAALADDMAESTDGEDDEVEVEEAELLVLPRVGLLAVTACSVHRTTGGVFSESYAHKLFLDQEDQVIALRAEQQRLQRHYVSSSPSPSHAALPRHHSVSGIDCGSGANNGAATSGSAADLSGSPAPTRAHITLRPYLEAKLQRQQALSMGGDTATATAPGDMESGEGGGVQAGAAAQVSRNGVHSYLGGFFRSGYASRTTGHSGSRPSRTGTFVDLFSRDNIAAAAAAEAAAAAMPATASGATCSATATAFTAAASVLAASAAAALPNTTSTQPTVVLKIESKSRPTVWLEFADEATLTYVYHILETPLRSVVGPGRGRQQSTSTPTVEGEAARDDAASPAEQGKPTRLSATPSPSSPDTSFAASGGGSTSSLPSPPSPSAAAVRRAGHVAEPLSCWGNRFLSSARRPCCMVPLLLIAAEVLPRGSAASPFMVSFLKNISVAMAMLHTEGDRRGTDDAVQPTTTSAVVAPRRRLADTWWLYDPTREFIRQGLCPDRWSLTRANEAYALCPTYPSAFVVPAPVAAAMECGEVTGEHRVSRRVEAVSFVYAPTGGVLVRSAQPAIAHIFVPSAAAAATATGAAAAAAASPTTPLPLTDVPFLILNAFAAAAGVSPQQLVVMDLRIFTHAVANTVRGGGTMNMLSYPFGAVEYAGLPNIHEIRHAWLRVRHAVLDLPYRLSTDSGARRGEVSYVLSAGEPPYAAVVAAAERCAATSRPPASLMPPALPSSAQRERGTPERLASATAVSAQPVNRGVQQQQQQAARVADGGAGDGEEKKAEANEAVPRPRWPGVVQQAPLAARSGADRTHATAAAPGVSRCDGGAGGGVQLPEDTNKDGEEEGERSRGSGLLGAAAEASSPTSRLALPFSSGYKNSGSNIDATAAEQAEQEWLSYLARLMNTAVVAARRVCGVPTDPLYVPAMTHNGSMENCFSYVVGHAFTRLWLPVGRGGERNGDGGRRTSRVKLPDAAWWRQHGNGAAAGAPPFSSTTASFAASAHRSLAHVVLLNCSDGWDRTAQVSVLTQLLLDPYYRTVEGLCILLEREVVCFGHPLQKRSTVVRGNVNGGWEVARERDDVGGGDAAPGASRAPATGVSEDAASRPAAAAAAATEDSVMDDSADALYEGDLDGWQDLWEEVVAAGSDASALDGDAQYDQQQMWKTLVRRAMSAVSGGTAALKQKMEARASAAAASASSSARGGSGGASSPSCLSDASPILAQLLDAIHQLVRLYPAAFEFTEQFVVLVMDLVHCGLVGSFAVNCERQVEQEMAQHGTLSLSQWCALLLSTTVAPVRSPAAPPTSATAAREAGPTVAPSRSSQSTRTAAAGAPDASLTATLSSVEASFQRLDSQFLVNAEDDDEEEGETTHVAALLRTPPSSTRHAGATDDADTPPAVSMHKVDTPAPVSSPPPQQQQQRQQQQQQQQRQQEHAQRDVPSSRAVYHFDYTTRWYSGAADTLATVAENRADESSFRRRLLPLSLDALYSSGYINPEFSLRHNRVVVGPLVSFILPAQLTLWRDVYARHSFWHRRSVQLQHGVAPVNLSGEGNLSSSGGGGGDGAHTPYSHSCSSLHPQHRGGGGGDVPKPSSAPSLSGASYANAAAAAAGTSRTWQRAGEPWGRRGTHSSSGYLAGGRADDGGRGSCTETPLSSGSLPGMLNFHLASGSDEEGEGEEGSR